MRYQVVWFFGDGPNDYEEHTVRLKCTATDALERNGFHYSCTYGREDVYHDESGHIGSIVPMEES
jgi:hypothetical protein